MDKKKFKKGKLKCILKNKIIKVGNLLVGQISSPREREKAKLI